MDLGGSLQAPRPLHICFVVAGSCSGCDICFSKLSRKGLIKQKPFPLCWGRWVAAWHRKQSSTTNCCARPGDFDTLQPGSFLEGKKQVVPHLNMGLSTALG